MRLESIRLKNFKAFRDVTFDRLPEFCVLVGANGTGKSTLFDVFRFLKDALTYDLGEALYRLGGPRGFDDVRSRDSEGAIEIELKFRFQNDASLAMYFLSFGERDGKLTIRQERLCYYPKPDDREIPLLNFRQGHGKATLHEPNGEQSIPNDFSLKSPDTLALKAFALQKNYPVAVKVEEFLKNHHVSDFNIQRSRLEQSTDFSKHLSREGNNLALVAERLYSQHPDIFRKVLERLRIWVPGVGNVESKIDEGGRVLLRIQDGTFKDPFRPENISDGTLGIFAYLVLLHDLHPHSLLCVEEPENQLYPTLLEELGGELRYYAVRGGGQVIVSTHSPDFLNACRLDEVFWLEKENGYTKVLRAADDPQIAAYMNDGDKMGYLWSEGFFGKVHPR